MIRVQVVRLGRAYEGVKALDGAVLDLAAGERTVVLGPSGAGKTVLARVVAGLEPSDSGDVRFDGRSMLAVAAHERKVGYVPADDGLWPLQSVSQNVGYALKIRRIARRERRIRVGEALEAARVDGLGDRRPDALSPLQRKKVAIARALVTEPDLLILDEPTAGLDPRGRGELRDEILRIHAEAGLTTLILTADPRDALALADTLAVMDFGKVVQVGAPGEVYNRPADGFVAQMLGPANLIGGHADSIDGRGEVVVRSPLGRLIGRAWSGEPPTAGAPVTLAIRPEALGLGPTVPPDANRFAATVERTVLLGATRQIFLRGPGDWPVTALALQAASDGLRDGQAVTVSVAPEFVVVLSSRAGRGGEPS